MSELSIYSPFCFDVSIKPLPEYPSVLLGSAIFSQTAYQDHLFVDYGITRPESLKNAVVKRKSEFLAGRALSSIVLRQLGVTETEILIGKHRNPLWPQGARGSISHAGDTVLSAVSLEESVSAIGIDVEEIMGSETASNIYKSIVNDDELALMAETGIPFEKILTIVFSAKESFFKAAYPSVGEYFDFDAVSLVKVDLRSQSFTFCLERNLSSCFQRGRLIHGDFSEFNHLIITYIVL